MTATEYLWKFAERAGDGWSVVMAPGGVQEVRHACGLALHMWDRPCSPLVDGFALYRGSIVEHAYGSESPAVCMAALVAHFGPLRVAVAGAWDALVAP